MDRKTDSIQNFPLKIEKTRPLCGSGHTGTWVYCLFHLRWQLSPHFWSTSRYPVINRNVNTLTKFLFQEKLQPLFMYSTLTLFHGRPSTPTLLDSLWVNNTIVGIVTIFGGFGKIMSKGIRKIMVSSTVTELWTLSKRLFDITIRF